VEQREELEIETRLRAALAARSELVTHSTLRPGIPPNEHTAGLKTKPAGWWSWRRLLVPVTVAAALGGGVFVGAQLNDDSGKNSIGATASGGTPVPQTSAPQSSVPQSSVPQTSAPGAAPVTTPGAPGTDAPTGQATSPGAEASPKTAAEVSVGTLRFTAADGWQVTPIDATSACVVLKGSSASSPAGSVGSTGSSGSKDAGLPCGVDALYLKSDAAPDAWPRSTATKATGWWPQAVDSPSQIVCPTAKRGAADHVADSVVLRSSTKYLLGAGSTGSAGSAGSPASGTPATAEYHEWAVTCDEGAGVRPMLWELPAAGGAAGAGKVAVATVVSSDPAYDTALLDMVGTLHLAR
jgi:hypothetical protein